MDINQDNVSSIANIVTSVASTSGGVALAAIVFWAFVKKTLSKASVSEAENEATSIMFNLQKDAIEQARADIKEMREIIRLLQYEIRSFHEEINRLKSINEDLLNKLTSMNRRKILEPRPNDAMDN